MTRTVWTSVWGMVLALSTGACAPANEEPREKWGGHGRVATTRGGAIALTFDEKIAVVANRGSGIVTVFRVDDTRTLRRVKELNYGLTAQPWAVVVGADDDTAYVVLRGEGKVVSVVGLHTNPAEGRSFNVGAEPTAIAITPSGKQLYIANWGDGTVSVLDTADLTPNDAINPIDLNGVLVDQGVFGPLVEGTGVTASSAVWTEDEIRSVRPGLAHPRALAMTDDGDAFDEDEMLYATEFFSQPLPDGEGSDDVDQSRQGLIYRISMDRIEEMRAPDWRELPPIRLSPVVTGFADAEGRMTSCFPNQLHAAVTDGARLLVTSMCASPRGPLGSRPCSAVAPGGACSWDPNANFKTLVHPVIFSVDTSVPKAERELPQEGVVLTRKLQDLYDQDSLLPRRMPLIPNDIAITKVGGVRRAYVAALGADAVFRVDYEGAAPTPDPGFINDIGSLPIGLALSRAPESSASTEPFMMVLTEGSQTLWLGSLDGDGTMADTVLVDPRDGLVREGRNEFATGLGVWSFGGEAWSSCESCHPDGLSDGVTWEFSRGPRRTISTAGTYRTDARGDLVQRALLWTANIDQVHDVEVIARNVSGGVGGVVHGYTHSDDAPSANCRILYDGTTASPVQDESSCGAPKATEHRHDGLNGSLVDPEAVDPRFPHWNEIDAFIRQVRAPMAPRECSDSLPAGCLVHELVVQGKELFQARCGACHAGPGFTVSRLFYEPSSSATGSLPYGGAPSGAPVDRPGWLGELRTRSYRVPDSMRLLNPPAAATGSSTFRRAPAPDAIDSDLVTFLFTASPHDQLNCALRSVGTFPSQDAGPNDAGVVAPGARPVRESRLSFRIPDGAPAETPKEYVPDLAVGATGFNVPSLFGLGLGGPYFHAGNARTLEELFDPTFAAHHQIGTLVGTAPELGPREKRALVSYLLSIDETSETVAVPSSDTGQGDLNPDLCAQW